MKKVQKFEFAAIKVLSSGQEEIDLDAKMV